MYPKISSPYTIGITLSEQGANRMNEKNKSDWLNNDESENWLRYIPISTLFTKVVMQLIL